MTVPGLCSVTFRSLEPAEIVELARSAGLAAIEWGGDIHVPHGELDTAREVGKRTEDSGLASTSYGSYLRAGRIDDLGAMQRTLDTAVVLGAPNVRVWAKGVRAVDDLVATCASAAERSLTISLEFHPGTSTETAADTNRLIDAVDAPNLFTYWQPHPDLEVPALLAEVEAVAVRLSHLHVFRWRPDGERLPLTEGADLWPSVLERAHVGGQDRGGERVAFLEFVKGDDPAQLAADAATLNRWLSR